MVVGNEAKAEKKVIPLPGFAGFSNDGKMFAWVQESALSAGIRWTKQIGVGDKEAKQKTLDMDLEAGGAGLAKAGFSRTRRAPPADLTLETDLTATPPRILLKRQGKTVDVPQLEYPYPPTDVAELWGVSADGKYVAVHVSGMSVEGVLTKANTGVFHFVFVAPMP